MNVHRRIRLQYTRAWIDGNLLSQIRFHTPHDWLFGFIMQAHHSLLTSREWSIETDPQTWLKENIVCTWNFTVTHNDHRSWEKTATN
ncbi:hypothetical protein T11_13960 [Trichinella zimbabwensis]|uniref:Uncharacterized protein n=1 Tax=Trichinella zimbabwensis TaxID=268475 RepID=A0A0V1HXQ3_9BILA|nr:hypothetical protein T11_13960 [Trichinella zimbabwensis]